MRGARPAALGILAVTVLLSSGCVAARTDAGTTPTPVASGTFSALSFADGDALSPEQTVAWSDELADADGFLRDADAADGSWSYTAAETDCTVAYRAGALETEVSALGDAAASESLLAAQFGATVEEIADFVEDGPGRLLTHSRIVQTAAARGADAEASATYLVSARAFTALSTGLVATLTCPSEIDIAEEWDALNSTEAAFAVSFTATAE